MTRTNQRRRRVLRAFAPVAGLLAVGLLVWQGSYAAFSATTNNTGDSWATGALTLQNDAGTGTYAGSTSAVFTETALKPGSTNSKCITVAAGGTAGGTLKFYRGAITGTTNPAALSAQLTTTIQATAVLAAVPSPAVGVNCGNFPAAGISTITPVGATLSSLPSTYAAGLGSFVVPAGARWVTYKITYTFTSTGTSAGDNALQSSDAAADLNWEIQ
jgi:hypothetical protein